MIWNLTPEEVVRHWDLIKYGVYEVNKPVNPEKYFIGLIKQIWEGMSQVWFFADEERNIKTLILTKIIGNIAGINEFLIDTVYGYSSITPAEQKEGFEAMIKFARNMKLSSVIAFTSQPGVGLLAQKAGMSKINEVYKLNVGGVN